MRLRPEVATLVLAHPVEAYYRLSGQLEGRRVDAEREEAKGAYTADRSWLRHLHDELGAGDCREAPEFEARWQELESLAGGLDVDSHDGDGALARATWCVIRHGGAERVVETGVARGVYSRMLLEALTPDGAGRLWSVDLPLLSKDWADVLASAVPDRLRPRWSYLRGPSRRALPRLLSEIGPIDLFVQDSRSTVATASFEFDTAWNALRSGGFLIANSVDRSVAFARFVERMRPSFALTAPFDEKPGLFGIARKG